VCITVEELEEAAALGWRGVEEDRLGGWLLRAAGGFTGRANSALAIGDPGRDLGPATETVVGWYQARGLPAMIAVPYPAGRPHASALNRFLDAHGWGVRSGAATVMTAPIGAVARDVPVPGGRFHTGAEPDGAWLALYHYRGQPRLPPVARKVLMSAPWQAFGSIRAAGETLAIGRVAVAAGWAGLTAIETAAQYRRRGLATAITSALAAVAAGQGAKNVYLQVEDTNSAALALYRHLGFTEHHGYHYRTAQR
jgi:ribosomal protein S18 acetylase RimI-like enzyme